MNQEFNAFAIMPNNGCATSPAQNDSVFRSGQTLQLRSGIIVRIVRVKRLIVNGRSSYILHLLKAGAGEEVATMLPSGRISDDCEHPLDILGIFDHNRELQPIPPEVILPPEVSVHESPCPSMKVRVRPPRINQQSTFGVHVSVLAIVRSSPGSTAIT